jgi:ferric-dicitrate binding protein FerR (iron transport regulator)
MRVARGADVQKALAWTTNTLVFDGTPLGDAMRTLARWYDLDIRLADESLARRPLTATFRGEAVPDVLDRIALALKLRVEQHGRVVIFRSADSSVRAP